MRLLTALVALAALAMAAACAGGSGAPPPACAGLRRPGVSLAAAPAAAPTRAAARCMGAQYSAVIGRLSWRRLPRRMRAASPNLQVWQERSLLYACNRCGLAGFGLGWVRRHHPSWIMHSPLGLEVHPLAHPSWSLLDFTDPKYQYAWAVHVRHSLITGGWTGVDVIDANNDPDWSEAPIDPADGKPMTDAHRRRYLASALALVRATLKIRGYSLLAANGPPDVIDLDQINSTDAVSVPEGFARLSGAAFETEMRYYQHVDGKQSGTYVFDAGPLPRSRMLYGLAGFLLVAIPRDSAYIAPAPPGSSLYAISPGVPPDTPATAVGPVWMRTYPNAVVAVNPSDAPATVTLGSAGAVTVQPRSAAIETGGHVLQSG
jgi:hypothetical protein